MFLEISVLSFDALHFYYKPFNQGRLRDWVFVFTSGWVDLVICVKHFDFIWSSGHGLVSKLQYTIDIIYFVNPFPEKAVSVCELNQGSGHQFEHLNGNLNQLEGQTRLILVP